MDLFERKILLKSLKHTDTTADNNWTWDYQTTLTAMNAACRLRGIHRMRRTGKARRMLAWLPALSILATCAVITSGVSLTSWAGAASSEQVIVQGDVSATVDISPTCSGSALDLGTLTTSGSFVGTGTNCVMVVSTNDTNGAQLTVNDDRTPNTSDAFCKPIDCATANSSVTDADAGTALANDEFGIALQGVSGTGATGTYTTNAAGNAAGAWYPVSNAAVEACRNASTASMTCNFRFGVDTKDAAQGGQNSGSYDAYVLFTAVAL